MSSTRPRTQALSHARLLEHELPALPGTDRPGFQRTAYEGITGPDFRTVLIQVPPQQQSTFRVSSVDHIILVLDGELRLIVEDEDHVVDKWGQIFVPHGVGWTYRNATQTDATFVSITNTPAP
jgi:glyoxylate utilization-related uncharacterized protein